MSKYSDNYSAIDWSKELPEPPRKVHGMKRPLGVISDDLPGGAMLNHADGTHYTSKAKFRQATRAAGCIEVGNEQQRDTRRWDDGNRKADIARAIEQLGG